MGRLAPRVTYVPGRFLRTTALVSDRWNRPGLGEWDVRALVETQDRIGLVTTIGARLIVSATDLIPPRLPAHNVLELCATRLTYKR